MREWPADVLMVVYDRNQNHCTRFGFGLSRMYAVTNVHGRVYIGAITGAEAPCAKRL